MKFAAKYTPEQWAEARRLRAEGLIFRAVAKSLGFKTSATVSTRARKEGWWGSENTGVAGLAKGKPRGGASPATAPIRRALAVRLYSFIEFEIRMKELRMKKQLDDYAQSPAGTEPPAVTKEERESFAALIEQINLVTEMASEPASAADGRRKSAINLELTALSDDIDPTGLAIASEKDQFRREIAEKLEKLLPPA